MAKEKQKITIETGCYVNKLHQEIDSPAEIEWDEETIDGEEIVTDIKITKK